MASKILNKVRNPGVRVFSRLQSHTSSVAAVAGSRSETAVAVNPAAIGEAVVVPPPPGFGISTEGLYSAFTTKELIFSLLNQRMVSFEPLADFGLAALRSPLMKYSVYNKPLMFFVKRTAFAHFSAGETVDEASFTLNRMWSVGLKGILDYSLEDAATNADCDANLQQFLATVDTTLQLPAGSVSFSCVKITALCPLKLLERVSHLLRWQHKNPSFKLPWKADCLPVLAPTSPTYHTQSQPEPLSQAEEKDLMLSEQRLFALCRACEAAEMPLLVDAEYTYVQPAIDYLTYRAFSEFNKGCKPLVYGTLQAYLKDSLPRLTVAAEEAKRQGISLALKLVRGAYITRETAEAQSFGAPSPVNPSILETHRCYDSCTEFLLKRIAAGEGSSLVLATHNFESEYAKLACLKSEELGIRKSDNSLQFAQLKGMADSLSMRLVKAGFQVNKYLPYGPVEQVMPYLLRRAEENKGLLSASHKDAQIIKNELIHRLKGGVHI